MRTFRLAKSFMLHVNLYVVISQLLLLSHAVVYITYVLETCEVVESQEVDPLCLHCVLFELLTPLDGSSGDIDRVPLHTLQLRHRQRRRYPLFAS